MATAETDIVSGLAEIVEEVTGVKKDEVTPDKTSSTIWMWTLYPWWKSLSKPKINTVLRFPMSVCGACAQYETLLTTSNELQ